MVNKISLNLRIPKKLKTLLYATLTVAFYVNRFHPEYLNKYLIQIFTQPKVKNYN